MYKLFSILLVVILACIIGGVYGALHDQLTYSISEEYYTKFKFYQFHFCIKGNECILPNPRIYVAGVGFMATWWVGLPIGLILGLVAARIEGFKAHILLSLKALGITLTVAFLTGLVGLFIGFWDLAESGVDWIMPENLVEVENFIAVGSMHNYSYLGGLIGLIAGIIYLLIYFRKSKS